MFQRHSASCAAEASECTASRSHRGAYRFPASALGEVEQERHPTSGSCRPLAGHPALGRTGLRS
eukprot:15478345-Alexandrium_andersonii.AAC.1